MAELTATAAGVTTGLSGGKGTIVVPVAWRGDVVIADTDGTEQLRIPMESLALPGDLIEIDLTDLEASTT
jgi:hypothetical protein